ncbi:MAG: (2Fe-2S) ferredoxin domain-containing protein [Bacteroidales bacterium]|nr:(2Fe-2S) ferredoxin domain-containing protein [Bacteroidales bacterium]
MTKVKSLADLKAMREKLHSNLDIRERAENPESMVQVKVAMATCGIAAGAKQVMEHMMQKADEMGIQAVFTQSGCMGYCYAEPTLEVRVPGKDPIVFGYVDNKRADEILEKYVQNGELVEGIIPVNYDTVDNK